MASPVDPRARYGFTLIELAIVLVIVGLLTMLATARISRVADRLAVDAATREVVVAFSTARHFAVARRASVAVFVDTLAAEIRILDRQQLLQERALGRIHRVSLAVSRDSMSYGPRGLGRGAANLRVIVMRGRATDTVFVSRLGRVRR